MKTSAAAKAAATVAGGSVPRAGLGGRIGSTAWPSAARAARVSALPSAALPGSATMSTFSPARARAALDHGPDRPIEVVHPADPAQPEMIATLTRPGRWLVSCAPTVTVHSCAPEIGSGRLRMSGGCVR
jgi:hypothetical protein